MNKLSAKEGLRQVALYGLTVGGFAVALAGCSETKKVLPSSAQCSDIARTIGENPGRTSDYALTATADECAKIKRTRLFAECPGGQDINAKVDTEFSATLTCQGDGSNPRIYRMSDEWQSSTIPSADFAKGMIEKYPNSTLVEVTTPNTEPLDSNNGGFTFDYYGTDPVVMHTDEKLPILGIASLRPGSE